MNQATRSSRKVNAAPKRARTPTPAASAVRRPGVNRRFSTAIDSPVGSIGLDGHHENFRNPIPRCPPPGEGTDWHRALSKGAGARNGFARQDPSARDEGDVMTRRRKPPPRLVQTAAIPIDEDENAGFLEHPRAAEPTDVLGAYLERHLQEAGLEVPVPRLIALARGPARLEEVLPWPAGPDPPPAR